MAVANGRLDVKMLTPIPAKFHTHGTTAYLQADAAAAFLRVAAAFEKKFGKRLVAMSFYRPLSDQIRIFLKNYYKVNRPRKYKTDRTFNGATYAKRSGMAPVASPGHSNHGLGITVDFNAGVQRSGSPEHTWMLKEGTKYGWDWTEGKRIGEPWHWTYVKAQDRMRNTPATSKAGRLATDGRWGRETTKALQRFLNSRVKTRKLAVDGRTGPDTWRSLQEYLHHPVVDGLIDNQSHKPEKLGDGISPNGWRYTGRKSKGSKTIRRLQKWVGVEQDGVVYKGTVKALQAKLNTHGVGM